jgi:hypothetical protein
MQKWIKNKGKRSLIIKKTLFIWVFRHVVTELLATEQVYVEELRTIIEVYRSIFLKRFVIEKYQ